MAASLFSTSLSSPVVIVAACVVAACVVVVISRLVGPACRPRSVHPTRTSTVLFLVIEVGLTVFLVLSTCHIVCVHVSVRVVLSSMNAVQIVLSHQL